ncbi:MAG: AraC family transcriptional regulator [Cyanobacteria bacterium P01_H01_bin.119]
MAIKLTDKDLQDICSQAEQQGEQILQPLELGYQGNLPQQLGQGGERTFNLRSGLSIRIRRCRLAQEFEYTRQHGACFSLISKFYLSGGSRVQSPDVTDIDPEYEELKGNHYLYHLPDQTEIEHWPNKPLYVVYLSADPGYFSSFDGAHVTLPPSLQKLITGDRTQRFHQPLGCMTPTIKLLLQQILHCPYTGFMQQIYLESKALELFAAQFALWTEASTPNASMSLCAHDIEQLHQAKEILIRQAVNPPSLVSLARQVGLNDRKLNQGFRHLFGTTVFDYLQGYRLEQAKELLSDSGLTVSGVAAKVGYRSPEAFSNAFRRKFAVNPKTYQLSQQRKAASK